MWTRIDHPLSEAIKIAMKIHNEAVTKQRKFKQLYSLRRLPISKTGTAV